VLKLPPIYDNEKGMVLSVALMVLAILTLMGSAAIVATRTEVKIAGNWNAHTRTFYAAEAGLEKGIGDLKALLASTSDPTSSQLAAITPPVLSDPNISFEPLEILNVSSSQIVIGDGTYQGLRADATDYQITAEVKGPAGTRSRLVQVVEYLEIPLFQFGVFYGRGVNLEISPGPAMTFNGRVHSNSNLYLAGGNPLKFDSFVTTVGDVYRYQRMNPSNRSNDPQIKDASGSYQTLSFDHEYNRDFINPWSEAEWKSEALTTFGGKLLDSAMGVEEILPPVPDALYDPANAAGAAHQLIEKGTGPDSDAMKKAKMYYQADLRIVDGSVKDGNGSPVNTSSCDPNAITDKTFYDPREQTNVTVTEVDIGLLMACGVTPANGIMYVSKDGSNKGVRLVNGAQLPSQGLTVVSENPVYVQGNYNTVSKVPAAVMGDAITVLSSNWDDAMSNQSTSSRPAIDTAVNAAFALGPNRESTGSYNNGGLENAIRFLEDWGGRTFQYRGSIVGLWHNQQATADHRCCGSSGTNYYNAPNRDWGYDTLFDTAQPPGTPKGVLGLTRVAWSEGQI
jgi:hypothetical protein